MTPEHARHPPLAPTVPTPVYAHPEQPDEVEHRAVKVREEHLQRNRRVKVLLHGHLVEHARDRRERYEHQRVHQRHR